MATIANGGGVGNSDGSDILFTLGDGVTKLNHEIESYSSSTGAIIAWINVPTLSPTVDTTLYIYYGNAGAANQQNAAGVWNSNYKAVYHLPNGSSLSTNDSTSNAKNGTNHSVTANAGKIDGGGLFSSAYVSVGNTGITDSGFTIECWINAASLSQYPNVWTTNDQGGNNAYRIEQDNANLYVYNGSTLTYFTTSLAISTWYHIVAVSDGVNIKTYINGNFNSSNSYVTGNTLNNFVFGRGFDSGRYFNGSIDEVRVSNVPRSADWIVTEYNNQSSPSTFFKTVGAQQAYSSQSAAAWYNNSWSYRKKITIDHTKVSGVASSTLNSFPILVSVTDSDLKFTGSGGKVASSTGADILFTAGDGVTALNYEIENYASTTGNLVAWVRIPVLSAVNDTAIYAYFGNAAAPANTSSNIHSTWDSNYLAVWHMGDNAANTTILDSTSNGKNGTSQANTNTKNTAGQVANGQTFNGSSDYEGSPSYGTPPTSFTIEAWAKPTASGGILFDEQGGPNQSAWHDSQLEIETNNVVKSCVWTGSSTCVNSTSTLVYGNWNLMATRYNSSNTTLDGVINGVVGGTNAAVSRQTPNTGAQYWHVGVTDATNSGNGNYFSGSADEVRVSNIVRSNDWLKTEYNNQSSPSTFYSYSSIQTQAPSAPGDNFKNRGAGTGWYNSSWSYRKLITIDHTKVGIGTTTPLTNFPMLFSVTDSDLRFTGSGGKVASSTGADIIFTKSDGTTLLNYEIESYSSTTGNTIAWVNIPSLSPSSDTAIYVYFGKSSAPANSTANAQGTWDSNYKMVQHFPNGTTLGLTDSTSNGNNGSNIGTPTAGTGQADGGLVTSSNGGGTRNAVTIGTGTGLDPGSGDFTLSYWLFKQNASVSYSNLWGITKWNTGAVPGTNEYVLDPATGTGGGTDDKTTFSVESGSTSYLTSDTVNLTLNTWNLIVGVRNGTSIKLYKNGLVISSASLPANTTINTPGRNFKIGDSDNSSNFAINAHFDEVTYSSIARTADWIATEYNNQSSPSSFYSYSAVGTNGRQTSGGAPVPAIKVRGGIRFR